MPDLIYTEDEIAFKKLVSYVPPEKEEYEQSNLGALFLSSNATYAMKTMGDKQLATYPQIASQKPYSKDTLKEYIKENPVSPNTEEVLSTENYMNWQEAFARIDFLKTKEKAAAQVQEQFTAAEQLIYGTAAAILDPVDALLLAPPLIAAEKIRKVSNLATTASKVAFGIGEGAVVGAGSMLNYEMATGVYEDGSMVNGALFGAAAGGSLSYFLSKASSNPNLVVTKDDTGRIISEEDGKIEEIAAVNLEREKLDSLLKDVEDNLLKQKEVKAQLEVAKKFDKDPLNPENISKNEVFETELGDLKKDYKVKEDFYKSVKKEITALEYQDRSLRNRVTNATANVNNISNKVAAELKAKEELTASITKVKAESTSIQVKINKFDEGDFSEETLSAIVKLEKELETKTKQIKKLEAGLIRADTKISKIEVNAPTILKTLLAEKSDLEKLIESKMPSLSSARDSVTASKEAVRQKNKAAKTKLANESLETKKLKERLADFKVDLSADGLRELARLKQVADEDLNKMLGDDFKVSKLRTIVKEKQNFVAKLSRELDDVDKQMDFKKSNTFKALPAWTQKLMISPVEKLYASGKDMVIGITQAMHPGTVHHGKVQTNTAHAIRGILDRELGRTHQAITYNYKLAVKEGYTGNLAKFQEDISDNMIAVNSKVQYDLYTGIPATVVGLEREARVISKLGSVQRQHSNPNKYIQASTDDFLDYYEMIHKKAIDLDVDITPINKGFSKRIYNPQKIEKLEYNGKVGREAAIDLITDSQIAWAKATNSELTREIAKEFRDKATAAVDGTVEGLAIRNSIVKPLGRPAQSTVSSLKQRTIDAFDKDLARVLDTDAVGITNIYGLSMHGKLALKEKLGVTTDDQFEALIKQSGADPKEAQNMRVVYQTIKGTREISKNPFNPATRIIKGVSSYVSAMHTLGFGVTSVTEIASIAKEFGWSKTVQGFIGTPLKIIDMYKNGTPRDKNTIEMLVSFGDANFSTKVNRADVDTSIDSVGIQKYVDNIVRKEAVFGGLLPVTDMLRMTTAALSVDFMAGLSVASRISSTDRMRLQDMGFDLEDLPLIRDTLKVQPDGRILESNRNNWGKLDDRITKGVMTMVDRTILHPNGATLPKFMTDMSGEGVLPLIVFKFMRFPAESYERMLLRGIQEADAKQLLGLAGNIALWTVILSAKDALRAEDKQQYTGEEGMNKLMMDSFLYNSYTAGPVSLADMAFGSITGEKLTSDYRHSIGGAATSHLESLQQGQVKLTVPFYNIKLDIGEATGNAINTIFALEEANK